MTADTQEYGDLRTGCSCPDWANPCKHTAAVFYLLGEEFDRSPMLLLKMRGVIKERLMLHLGATPLAPVGLKALVSETLPIDAKLFWGKPGQVVVPAVYAGELPKETPVTTVTPPAARSVGTAALIRRLGSVTFWWGEENFQVVMGRLYGRASKAAAAIVLSKAKF